VVNDNTSRSPLCSRGSVQILKGLALEKEIVRDPNVSWISTLSKNGQDEKYKRRPITHYPNILG